MLGADLVPVLAAIDTDECVEWPRGRTFYGYGAVCFTDWFGFKRVERVHRLSYQLRVGEIGDKNVLHTCDNRACMNHRHLYLGTQKENVQDMVLRRRCNSSMRLTRDQVDAIRRDAELGRGSQSVIAARHGVAQSYVSRLLRKNRRTWQ